MHQVRLMVIGLDSVSLTLLDRFKAACPAICRAMAQGVTGRALPAFPIYTPTNWAALATGADPATTAAAGWHNGVAGERLSTFDRRAIPCDTIFDAAARAGLRTLAIAYPSAHPTRSGRNMVLAPLDRGLVSNCLVPGRILSVEPDASGAFAFSLVEAPQAASGAALAKAVGATEDGAVPAGAKRQAAAREVQAYLFRRDGAAWALGFSPNPGRAELRLRADTWSDPIPVRVAAPGRPGECVVRVMVLDGGRRLAISECYDVGALGKPAGLARTVYDRLGPPTEHSVFYKAMARQFAEGREDRTVERLARQDLTAQADWIVRAAELVREREGFDVFYLHHHYPDSALHAYLAAAEGSPAYSRRQQAQARAAIRMCLEICDGLVAGLLRLAGPKTTVLLVSDHGNVPNRYRANLAARLVETGLTVLRKDGKVDRRHSGAWPAPMVGTWVEVNAPHGSARYEELQRRVIDALLDWRAPDGERAVALALRRKDSHLLGYGGRHCGDVTFHYNSGFAWGGAGDKSVRSERLGANHGPQMPVTFSKLSDNLAFFVLRGPGLRRGMRWDESASGHVRMEDLLPTACHAAGLPVPRDVTGAVRYPLLR